MYVVPFSWTTMVAAVVWSTRRWILYVVGLGLFGLFTCLVWMDVTLQQTLQHAWDESWSALRVYTALKQQSDPMALDASFNPNEAPRERVYDWTVDRRIQAPDGVPRLMYTINGKFPGPTIQATVGDTVVVHVRNHIWDDYQVPEPPITSKLDHVHPEGTDRKFAIHWHGLSMRGTQVMDGAAAFTSCPLKPGNETTYRFVVHPEDVGTHWYHSHVGTSRADGLWGMLIVHAREDERKVLKERAPAHETHWDEEVAIAVGDHFHEMSPQSLGKYVSIILSSAEPVPDSGLINGKHIFSCNMSRITDVPCPAGDKDEVGEYAQFHLRHDQQYRLRLVNVGSLADVMFSVDEHTMTVIEADGVLVEPMKVHRIPISPGQRYSVILHREPSSKRHERVWMRAELEGECFKYMNPVLDPFLKAIVTYDVNMPPLSGGWLSPLRARQLFGQQATEKHRRYTSASKRPTTQAWSPDIKDEGIPSEPCHDLEPGTLVPLIPDPAPEFIPERGDRREFINIEVLTRQKLRVPMAYMNLTSWRPYGARGPSQQPLLHRISHTNYSTVEDWEQHGLVNREHELVVSPHPTNPVVYELVLINLDDGPHPFHLHGHKFWVLHTGEMEIPAYRYKPEVQREFDLQRAMKRDTVVVPMLGHAIIRWVADNPGVWAFHCHMLVHFASGMAMAIVEQPTVLQTQPLVPQSCQ